MPPRRGRQSEESIEAQVRGDNAMDIGGVYNAPFPIYSEEEGERYRELHSKNIEVPTYFNFEVLDQIGLTDKFMTLCRRGTWDNFVRMNYPVYRDLTLEFFTSLRFAASKPKKLFFRLRGQLCYVDERMLRLLFGFAEGDIDEGHQSFTVSSYWKHLTDLDEYDPHIASNSQIINAELKLLHKFMCGVVFGKQQSTKCSRKELFLLWCIEHGHKPNMFAFFSNTLIDIAGRKDIGGRLGNSLGMGYVSTAVAACLRIDLSDLNMLNKHFFDVPYLTRCEIIADKTMQLRDPSTRTALKRRLVAAESSSRCQATERHSENEGQQRQPPQLLPIQQEHDQRSLPNWGMVSQQLLDNQKLILDNQQLMLENHRRTQQQLDNMTEQMSGLNERWVYLNNRVDNVNSHLCYVAQRMQKAWEPRGLDVPSPSSSVEPSDEGPTDEGSAP